MTRFHTDEYIDFLARVTPETFDEMTGHGSRCELNLDFRKYELSDLTFVVSEQFS